MIYLGAIITENDYSNYIWNKSNNGGYYAFTTTEHYVLDENTGKFGILIQNENSSEFPTFFDGSNMNEGEISRVFDLSFGEFVATNFGTETEDAPDEPREGKLHDCDKVFGDIDDFLSYVMNTKTTNISSKYDDDGFHKGEPEEKEVIPFDEIRDVVKYAVHNFVKHCHK